MSRFAGYRQKHSTAATRVLGCLVQGAALVTLSWKFFFYWGAAPRWDLIGLTALTSVLGIAWIAASVLAPAVPGQDARPPAEAASRGPVTAPPLPVGLPGPHVLRAGIRFFVAGALITTLVVMVALATAMGPNGERGRVAARIAGAGGVVGEVQVVRTVGDTHLSGNYKSGLRCSADLVVKVPSPRWPAPVLVRGAVLADCPDDGDEVKAYYAPGSPQAGVTIHTSLDRVFDGKPGVVWLAMVAPIIIGLLLTAAAIAISAGGRAGPRMLRADYAARRVRAVRATVDGAVRTETITSGKRLGSEKVEAAKPRLRLRTRGGHLIHVARPVDVFDPSVVVDDFAGVAGWLCFPQRWKLFQEGSRELPLVFVADDGRVFWSSHEISSRYGSDRRGSDPWSAVVAETEDDAVVPFATDTAAAGDAAVSDTAVSDTAVAEAARNRPPLRLVRYGRFHPVLHLPAARYFAAGILLFVIRVAITPDTALSWVLCTLSLAAMATGGWLLPAEALSAERARALYPTIEPEVIDKVPR